MANTKISQLTENTNPTGGEELVYAYNNANGKMTLDTMKAFVENNLTGYATTSDLITGLAGKQDTLVSGTNIRTINGASIMGSGDIIVTGGTGYTAGTGIDITGGVISATGGGGVTELTADANIWELSEGTYETEYELYYKTGSSIPFYNPSSGVYKQRITIIEKSGIKGYFAFSFGVMTGVQDCKCSFGYSQTSSDGDVREVKEWSAALRIYFPMTGTQTVDGDMGAWVTQIMSEVDAGANIRVYGNLYPGVTYTIIVKSVAAGENYTITVDGTTITNPLNITLPSSATKPCVITFMATDSGHAIVTGCTMGN